MDVQNIQAPGSLNLPPDRVTPRKAVDFQANLDDFRCAMLGAMGFGSHFIESQTGLSQNQIAYRLNKASVKRADYRNGTSKAAQLILQAAGHKLERRLDDYYNLKRLE
jgi:hypothetical protein